MLGHLLDKHLETWNCQGIRNQMTVDDLPRVIERIEQLADDGNFELLAELFDDEPRLCSWPDDILGYAYEAVIRTDCFPPHYLSSPGKTLDQATDSGTAPDRHYLAAIQRLNNETTQRNKIREWRAQWPEREPLWIMLYGLTRKASRPHLFEQLWHEQWPLLSDGSVNEDVQEAVLNHLFTKAMAVGLYIEAYHALSGLSDLGVLPAGIQFLRCHLLRTVEPGQLSEADQHQLISDPRTLPNVFSQCVALWGEPQPGRLREGLAIVAQALSQGQVSIETQGMDFQLYSIDSVLHGTNAALLPVKTIGHLLLNTAFETLGEDHPDFPQAQAVAFALGTPVKEVCASGQGKAECVDALLNFNQPQNWVLRAVALNLLKARQHAFIPKAIGLLTDALRIELEHNRRYPDPLSGKPSGVNPLPILSDQRGFVINCLTKLFSEHQVDAQEADALVRELLVAQEGPGLHPHPHDDNQLLLLLAELSQWGSLSTETAWLDAIIRLRNGQDNRKHHKAMMASFTSDWTDSEWTLKVLTAHCGNYYTRALLNHWVDSTERPSDRAVVWLERLNDDVESFVVDPDVGSHLIGLNAQPDEPTPLTDLSDIQLYRCAALFHHCTAPDEQGFIPVGQAPGPLSHQPDWLSRVYRDAQKHGIFSIDPHSPGNVLEDDGKNLNVYLDRLIPFPLEASLCGQTAQAINDRCRTLLRQRAHEAGADHRVFLWRAIMMEELQGYWSSRLTAHGLIPTWGKKLMDTLATMTESFALGQLFGVIFNVVNRAAGLKHEHGWDKRYTGNVAISMLAKDMHRALDEGWTLKSIPRSKAQVMPTSVRYALDHVLFLDEVTFDESKPCAALLEVRQARVPMR